MLKLVDDGEGIFPQQTREDALRRIATTIGHSHKRDLTPAQRREGTSSSLRIGIR